jgi:membrane fusion protein, heavy metal efflux system
MFHASPAMKLAVILSTAAAISQTACDRSRAADKIAELDSRHTAVVAAAAPSLPTVELTEEQQAAIRIESVGTHPFYVEREAVGSVSFEEDASVIQAESTLLGAAATSALKRKELARLQGLGEANGITQKEVDQAIADQDSAAAALKAARDAVRVLGKSDAQIDQLIATGKFERAPDRGFGKWVVANVNESDSPLVRVGQGVTVAVTSYPGRLYFGRVSRVYATVDPDTHRMMTRAQVLDPKDDLRPGMLANVTIRVGGPLDSIAVPITAVVREGDGTMVVWVTTDRHHFVQHSLKLGLQSDSRYQVLDGLRRGELVVVEGAVFLSNMLEAPPSD